MLIRLSSRLAASRKRIPSSAYSFALACASARGPAFAEFNVHSSACREAMRWRGSSSTGPPFDFRPVLDSGVVGVCPPKAKVTRSNRVGCATRPRHTELAAWLRRWNRLALIHLLWCLDSSRPTLARRRRFWASNLGEGCSLHPADGREFALLAVDARLWACNKNELSLIAPTVGPIAIGDKDMPPMQANRKISDALVADAAPA